MLKSKSFASLGAIVYKVNNWNAAELCNACNGVTCVVSALAGLRDVVIDAQKILLPAMRSHSVKLHKKFVYLNVKFRYD